MRLIHLTDPHMSYLDDVKLARLRGKRWSGYLSWRKNRRKRFLPAVLSQLTDAIKAENADQILLTGDLIQIGLEDEIMQATIWLDQLGPAEQVMLVPGNHDIYAKDSAELVFREWSRYLFDGGPPDTVEAAGNFPVLRRLDKLSLIGLSSACVTPVFMANGALGAAQLDKLDGLLQQAANEGCVVCLLIHHPPLPQMTNRRKGLDDADALQAVLARHPPLLIFHGHLHHNRELQWGDSRIYCTAAASSVSESSYRVIDIDERNDCWAVRMTLKSVNISDDGKLEFAVVDEQDWELSKNNG